MKLIAPLSAALSLVSAWAGPDWTNGVEAASGPFSSTATAIRPGSAGQLYVAGTLTTTSDDFVLLRYDRLGQERWRRVYDGPSSGADLLRALAVDSSGNAYAVGRSAGVDGVAEIAVLRYSANGVEKWRTRYRDPGNAPLDAAAAAVDPSGNVYVVGLRTSQNLSFDQLLLRFSNRGQLQWTRTNASGLTAVTGPAGVVADGTKAVYVVGMKTLSSASHVSLSRYLQNGELSWQLFHPGSLPTNNASTAAAVDAAGNLYVLSSDRVNAESPEDVRVDIQAEKVDRRGSVRWRSRHRGATTALLEPAALTLDSAGNVVVAGREQRGSNPDRSDLFVVSYDRLGRVRWASGPATEGNQVSVSGVTMASRRQGGLAVSVTTEVGPGNPQLVTLGFDSTGARRWQAISDVRLQPRGMAAPSPDAIVVVGDVLDAGALPRLVTLGYTVPKEKTPRLVRLPQGRTVQEGEATSFEIEARGTEPLTYQWLLSGQPIPGATERSYTIPQVSPEDSGDYAVEVRDGHGTALTPSARLALWASPVFLSAPVSQTVPLGSLVSFSAGVAGSEPIHLQWQHEGVDIPGAHDPFLVIRAVTPSDAGTFQLIASNLAGVAMSETATLEPVQDGPLDSWTWIEPYPQGNPLGAIAFGAGRFVAVSSGGTLASSTDGVTWAVSSAAAHEALSDVTWADGRFIAVGANANGPGILRLSEDGLEWRAQPVASSTALVRVAAGGGVILAANVDGVFFRSANGMEWTRHTPGIAPGALGYGNGLFVAADDRTLVHTSPDGITWTAHALPYAIGPSDIVYGGGKFVLVGQRGARVAVSSSGNDWTMVGYGADAVLSGITHGRGEFVAVAQSGSSYASVDGWNWYEQFIDSGTVYDVAYGNGVFTCVGDAGRIFTSPNPGLWTPRSIGGGDWKYRAVHSTGGVTVVVGDAGIILSSVGGGSFTPCAVSTFEDLREVTYGAGLWVAVGNNGAIQTSMDAAVWGAAGSPVGEDLYGATFGDGRFVVVGEHGKILTSVDGMDWRLRTSGTSNGLRAVFHAENTFVAVGQKGTLLSSRDGERWTAREAQTGQELTSVCFGNGLWVGAGDDGDFTRSTNGVDWMGDDSGFDKLEGLAYGRGLFVMSARGAILSSGDGRHWTAHFPGVTAGLRDLAFENGRVIGVGNGQTIIISDPVPGP